MKVVDPSDSPRISDYECDNCGSDLVENEIYCGPCARCTECSNIAETCEEHAKLTCSDCGDTITGEETAMCGSCGNNHDECGNYASCEECGDEANWQLCQTHFDDHMAEDTTCGECGTTDEIVYCRDCATEMWFSGAVPSTVTSDDGVITIGDTEVVWH